MDQDDLEKKLFILTGRLSGAKSAKEHFEIEEFELTERVKKIKNLLREGGRKNIWEKKR